jgi:hypothetical protein
MYVLTLEGRGNLGLEVLPKLKLVFKNTGRGICSKLFFTCKTGKFDKINHYSFGEEKIAQRCQ